MTLKVKLLPRTTIKGKVRGTGRDGIDGATGPTGPQGPQGIQGIQGIQGNPGSVGNLNIFNAKDYGAVGDGVHDDTTNIQAAIDAAIAVNSSNIYIPSGNYKITNSLYLDLPGNLRAHGNGPGGSAAFSLGLYGAPSCGNHEGFGTRIICTFNDRPALWVGPGQGMVVKDLCIQGVGGAYRANQPANGVGIAYTGEGAASRSRTDNVLVENFYTAFLTGANGDGLNDSNTWIKCACGNCAVGFWISQTQNFINSMYDCTMNFVTLGLLCGNGGGAHVFGGNWSSPSNVAAALPCSSISGLTQLLPPLGNASEYTFTATVTPDAYFTGPQGVYNAFVFPTAHFGLVPCTLTAFNSGTNVATFKLLQEWLEYSFGSINPKTSTDIEAELQANTKVYCSELVTTFSGANITAIGVHVENDNSPTTFILSKATFGGDRPNVIKQAFWNTNPGFPQWSPNIAALSAGHYATPSDDNIARYYVAHSFPFIHAKNTHLQISDCYLGVDKDPNLNYVDPVIIDGLSDFEMNRCLAFNANYRCANGNGFGQLNWDIQNQRFDTYYFKEPSVGTLPIVDSSAGPRNSTYWIIRPDAGVSPAFTASQLAILTGTLPAVGHYGMPWGGQIYRINDFTFSVQPHQQFYSAHHWYSYGQDLTTTNMPGLSWSYKGQANAVLLDFGSVMYMRVGLGVILNDGTSDVRYFVTGVYPGLGYMTVSTDPHFVGLTSGTKTALKSGSLIKQEPFAFTYIP